MDTQNAYTVSETAEFAGVSPVTVYNDVKNEKLWPFNVDPMKFHINDISAYRVDKVIIFFNRLLEFKNRTGVSHRALAMAVNIDPTMFSHWKRGVRVPYGPIMQRLNELLVGTDLDVVERIIKKVKLGLITTITPGGKKSNRDRITTVHTLRRIQKNLVSNGSNGIKKGSIESAKEWKSVVDARKFKDDVVRGLTETQKLCKATPKKTTPKATNKTKRKHTSNILDETMRNNIIDWMYRMGKSNAYVARMLDVSSSAIAGWLHGKNINMPNLRKVEALCRENDISMNEHAATVGYEPTVRENDVEDFNVRDGARRGTDDCSMDELSDLQRTEKLAKELVNAQELVRAARINLMDHLHEVSS